MSKRIIQQTEYTKHIGDVYKDINNIEINPEDSLNTIIERFYDVMSKWGICQGNWTENGRTVNTPEWCICWNVFISKIDRQLMFMGLMSTPPEHLLAYDK